MNYESKQIYITCTTDGDWSLQFQLKGSNFELKVFDWFGWDSVKEREREKTNKIRIRVQRWEKFCH